MESKKYAVIMAGGGGTRLWPHSRHSCPKQFLPLLPHGETLLSATVRRTRRLIPLEAILIVTTAEQVTEVRRCLPELSINNIIVEPTGRNTAPCIGLATLAVLRRNPQGPDPTIAVLPADHHVQDEDEFQRTLGEALAVAEQGHVVTIGVQPTRPETGYGYIELSAAILSDRPWVHLGAAFFEKPDRERASVYLAAGNYLWNSGMFFFPAQRILAEFRRHLPVLATVLTDIAAHPEHTAALYPEAPSISIDYAVMEKLGVAIAGSDAAIRVLTGNFGWNDVGSFASVGELATPDAFGNHIIGEGSDQAATILLQARNNIVWNSGQQVVTALGIDGLVIAITKDAVLVMPELRAQEVRQVVAHLKATGHSDLL